MKKTYKRSFSEGYRWLSITLAAVMLLGMLPLFGFGTAMKAEAADDKLYIDDMESDADEGWKISWSESDAKLERNKDQKDPDDSSNKSGVWNFYSGTAQKLTISREIKAEKAGSYVLSAETDGADMKNGIIRLSDGKDTREAELGFKGWAVYETAQTDSLTVEAGTTLSITIELEFNEGGWGHIDNVTVKEAASEEEQEKEPETGTEAADDKLYIDDMESDADEGWKISWSESDAKLERNKDQKDPDDSSNKSGVWNFYSGTAQKLTISREIKAEKAGSYVLSAETDGADMKNGIIRLSDGKDTREAELGFKGWAVYETAQTDSLTVEAGTTLSITIELEFNEGGWGHIDNVTVKKAASEEEQKAAKAEALKSLISECDRLPEAAYTAESYKVLIEALKTAKKSLENQNETSLEELEKAYDALKAAKDALVKAAPVDTDITVQRVDGLSKDFIHGIDVSTYLSEVQSGVKYYDKDGNEQNLFKLFKDAGVNWIRLRVWNCPYALDENGNYKYVAMDGSEYTADKVSKTQENSAGYKQYFLEDGTEVFRQGYGAGNIDADVATAIGKIATEYGIRVLVDFHYSDFWADPSRQTAPKAWAGMNIEEKANALYEYTKNSLQNMKAAGVDVGMVQVGNETNHGMAGETSNENFCTLLKAGSKAVREVDKDILIAVHFTDPQSEGYQPGKAGMLRDNDVDYDVFATSYYPFWHGTTESLTANLKEIADTYDKKVMVAEVSYPWNSETGDGYGNVVTCESSTIALPYPIHEEGQATAVRDVIAAVAAIGDAGLGTFYWEGAWVPVNAYSEDAENAAEILEKNRQSWKLHGTGWASIYAKEYDSEIKEEYNGNTWDNQAFFDNNGKVLDSLNVYKWVYMGADGPVKVSAVSDTSYEMKYREIPMLPDKVKVKLNDGRVIDANVTWNSEQTKALQTADFGEYVVEGSVDEFSYETDGEVTTVAAGTWTVHCDVKITGNNILYNGGFEENGGSYDGWTLTNFLGEDVGWPKVEKNSSNAKTGYYYFTAWNEGNLDFKIEQTVQKDIGQETGMENGKYTMFAWYQGTNVEKMNENSGLYTIVTYKDGTEKTYKADIVINNEWKAFYQARVNGIIINDKVKSVTVGTRFDCSPKEGGAWVVVDDISLIRYADIDSVVTPNETPESTPNETPESKPNETPESASNGTPATALKPTLAVTPELTLSAMPELKSSAIQDIKPVAIPTLTQKLKSNTKLELKSSETSESVSSEISESASNETSESKSNETSELALESTPEMETITTSEQMDEAAAQKLVDAAEAETEDKNNMAWIVLIVAGIGALACVGYYFIKIKPGKKREN